MSKVYYSLLLLVFIVLPTLHVSVASSGEVSEDFSLGMYYVPGVIDGPEAGSLVEALEEIVELAGIKFDVVFAPVVRIQKMFFNEQLGGYFPALDDHAPSDSCKTYPFAYKDIHAFWLEGTEPVKTLADLVDKHIGIVNGFSYGEAFSNQDDYSFSEASNDDVNIKKLMNRRVDYILGDARSTRAAIKNAGLDDKVYYIKEGKISSLPVFFVFKNEGVGKIYCEKVSAALRIIEQRGGFKTFR